MMVWLYFCMMDLVLVMMAVMMMGMVMVYKGLKKQRVVLKDFE